MNKSKIFVLIAITLAVLIGIYFLIPSSSPSRINVVITVLEKQNLNTYLNQVIEKAIEEVMINNPIEIDLSLLTASNDSKRKINIKMKPGDSELNWKNEVKKTVDKLLKDSIITSITNQSINDLIIQTLQMIKDKADDEGNYYILTGSFPECYDHTSSELLKHKINEIAKGVKTRSKFIWSVLDTRKNEDEILKSLITTNITSVIDRRIIFDKSRECIENSSQQVFGIFFDKLSNDQGIEFINYLRKNFGNNLTFTIWNDGPKNNMVLELSKNDSLNSNAPNTFSDLKKGRWPSIGYLLKQATNNFAQLPDSLSKNLVIIGNLPLEGTGNQLDAETWRLLQSIKKLSITLFRYSDFNENEIDKTLIDGLRYYKINFRKN